MHTSNAEHMFTALALLAIVLYVLKYRTVVNTYSNLQLVVQESKLVLDSWASGFFHWPTTPQHCLLSESPELKMAYDTAALPAI